MASGSPTSAWERMAVWVYDIDRGTASRLTGEGKASWPIWTPDGKRMVFQLVEIRLASISSGSPPMEVRRWSGSPRVSTANFRDHGLRTEPLSLLSELSPDTGDDILCWICTSRRVTPFLNSRSNESYPEFSPDGRWMAYTSDESGREKSMCGPFPAPEANGRSPAKEGRSRSGQGMANNSSTDGRIRYGPWMFGRMQASPPASPACCLRSRDMDGEPNPRLGHLPRRPAIPDGEARRKEAPARDRNDPRPELVRGTQAPLPAGKN